MALMEEYQSLREGVTDSVLELCLVLKELVIYDTVLLVSGVRINELWKRCFRIQFKKGISCDSVGG